MIRPLLLAGAFALPACGQSTEPADTPSPAPAGESADAAAPAATPDPRLETSIIGDSGEEIGTVELVEGPNGVLMTVTLVDASLAEGWHGLHVHAVGDCSDTGDFKRSGGHLGKVEGGHGLLNPEGPEKGDLPNIHVDANGAAAAQIFSSLFSFGDIQDQDGAALIMHESLDDHMSQPIGGAGARVGCAVLSDGSGE